MRRIWLIAVCGVFAACGVASVAVGGEPVMRKHRTNVRDWTVRLTVRMRPDRQRRDVPVLGDEFFIPRTGFIQFRDASFVLPILAESASHETYLDRLTARSVIRGKTVSAGVVSETDERPDEREVEITLGAVELRDVLAYTFEWPMTCYETRVDEAGAFAIEWPSGEWPEEVRSYLEPEAWVESDHADIAKLVEVWTHGRPTRAKPYYLAKFLAGKVLEHYAPTEGTYREQGVPFAGRLISTEDRSGFIMRGAAHAARAGTGSKNDLVNLLVAVYRAAGIPARLVIAVDPVETDRGQFPAFTVWAEFALYDEAADRVEWVPVDILEQRSFSSRAPAIDLPWEYFGNNRTFDVMLPVASHWEPLREGHHAHSGPALFGWLTDPSPQVCRQELRVTGHDTPMRAGYEELEKRRERSRPPGERE